MIGELVDWLIGEFEKTFILQMVGMNKKVIFVFKMENYLRYLSPSNYGTLKKTGMVTQ